MSAIWPWSRLERLQSDLRGARAACSAEAKRANRLAKHIRKLDARLERLRGQVTRDQAYIDRLEAHLDPALIAASRVPLLVAVDKEETDG